MSLKVINYQKRDYIQISPHDITAYFFTKQIFNFEIATLTSYESKGKVRSLHNPAIKDPILSSQSGLLTWSKYQHKGDHTDSSYVDYPNYKYPLLSKLTYYKYLASSGRLRICKKSLQEYQNIIQRSYKELIRINQLLDTTPSKDRNHNIKLMNFIYQDKYEVALKYIGNLLNGHSNFFHKYYLKYLELRTNSHNSTMTSWCTGKNIKTHYTVTEPIIWKPGSIGQGDFSNQSYKLPYKYNIKNNSMKPKITLKTLRDALIATRTIGFFYNGLTIEVKPSIITTPGKFDFSKSVYINGKPISELSKDKDAHSKWVKADGDFIKQFYAFLNTDPTAIFPSVNNTTLVKHLIFVRSSKLGETKMFVIKYTNDKGEVDKCFVKEFSEERVRATAPYRINGFDNQIIDISLWKHSQKAS